MQRTVYILFSLLISLAVYATKVDLQPSSSTLHTAMPNDTLYISQKGTYRVKITEIGKYHIEQTTKDTVEFKLQANDIVDEKIRNGRASHDTLQVSFKDILTNHQLSNNSIVCEFKADTCNIHLQFEGNCSFIERGQGYVPNILVSGKSPSFIFDGSKASFKIERPIIVWWPNELIQTKLCAEDTLTYYIRELSFNPVQYRNVCNPFMIKNNAGHVFVKNSHLIGGIQNPKKSPLYISDKSVIELTGYTGHNAVISSKGKIFIENATLQTGNTNSPLVESADTIFIDEKEGEKTFIDAPIGQLQIALNVSKLSRIIVNNASYIRRISTMADIYNGNIDLVCPSAIVKDSITNADINIYGGRIGQITNVLTTGGKNTTYHNRNINIYGGIIGGVKEWTRTGIHCGHTYYFDVPQASTLLNNTINLYGGKIQVPKDYSLINFTDNTVINIHHKDNPAQRTQFQFHPKHIPANGEYFNYIALIGDSIIGDSVHWEIGDMKHLVGIKSQLITESQLRCSKKAFRIVYKKSQQPNDSLVVGVAANETHYFGNLLDTYDIVHIYPAFKRNIHFVHTLDETWECADSTYEEGFGKASLPKVIYAGKTFRGWFTEPTGGIKVDSISHLQTGDITLYTQWGPGQDIIYSDFDRNVPSNMGGNIARYVADENNTIDYNILPLEDNNTFAIRNRFVQNEEEPFISFFLRTDRTDMYKTDHPLYVDLRHTTGISFYHKGSAVDLYICTKTTGHSYKHKYVITEHNELTLVNIPWGQFSNQSTFDLENIFKLTYHPQGERGEFWLDNIIFTKGEIYPIEKITLDTVPNQYLFTKNPDLLNIPLPIKNDTTQLFLYPKFTPSDATYQAVTWSSKDPSIATVDIYGRVNAISHGQTYIYCQSVMHPEVKDSILVGVSQGGIYYNLNGVSISNQLPTKYDYEHPIAIPAPQPINDFYTFHGWHTDSITGAVVDSASYYQFGNLKAHTLYAEFTREIPGAAITIMQNRIVAVQNPNNYDALKEARYVWKFNNQTLPSQKMFVEVGRPIPEGTYQVTMHIDDEMPIQLERYIDATINQDTDNNFTLYPNPIKAGQLAYLIGTFDSLALYDLNGLPIDTILSEDGVIKVPDQPGMYILKINANNQTYSIKLVVI